MKKYIIEEPKLVAILNKKMVDLMQASAEIFATLNPTMTIDMDFSDEEKNIIGQLQRGEILKEAIPAELVEKIDYMTKKIQEVDDAEKEGKVNLDIFSIEEVRKHLSFTDEEILSFLYGGSKKEQLPED